MHRAVQAWVVGAALLPAAACGAATAPPLNGPGGPGAASAPSAALPAEAATRSTCEAIGQVYGTNLAPFAKALTDLVAAQQSAGDDAAHRQQVRRSLTAFATAVRAATQQSTDPGMRADGARTADQLKAKAEDTGFLRTVKTTQDVNTVLGPTLKQWLSPVTEHCS